MISIITALFDGNEAKNPPPAYSRKYYSEEWVEKLYRSIKRNYSDEFRFICLCDKGYEFVEPIESHSTRSSLGTWMRSYPLKVNVRSIRTHTTRAN